MTLGMIIAICIVIASIVSWICVIWLKDDQWISTEEFQEAKKKLRPRFTEQEFREFMQFLYSYQGGYVRRQSGKIVTREYLGKEKGDLKGIFFNLVIPNPNITSAQKEEFRTFMRAVGVSGVEKRPSYETRDQKLKNNKKDENERKRKSVGNIGEYQVRKVLAPMSAIGYAVINGPALRFGDETREFDHLVIGKNGIFVIETKAYGMTDGKPGKADLIINSTENWIISKKHYRKEIPCPTEQIVAENRLLQKIVSCPVTIHPILLLCNVELDVKKSVKLPYAIVGINELVHYIVKFEDELTESDKLQLLTDIDQSRIN